MHSLMHRLPLVVLGCALLACPRARADNLEPIGAQGPSTRPSERMPSAYQQISDASESSATPEPSQEPDKLDHGRRLTPGSSGTPRRGGAHPSAQRGAALIESWAQSSAVTAAAALAFVVGLFMLFAWAMKRGMPKSSQVLPSEAVRVLGRVPLGARQFGHLLQLGNKLVLVSVSQAGVEKLAELDDSEEVTRLVALCGKTSSTGSQKEFEEIFGQFGKEKAGPGFLGSEASLFSDHGNRGSAGGRRYA